MKLFLALLLTIGFSLPRLYSAEQTAQVKMYCLSIVVPHVTDQHGHALDLSTVNDYNNGELPPDWVSGLNTGYTNSTWMTFLGYDGIIALDLPPFTDADNNGIPDFFEGATTLNAVPTVGAWDTLVPGPGAITALWYRNAGQPLSGGINLKLKQGSTSHDFFPFHQLYEYTGTITYTPGATNVSGSIHLELTGDTTQQLDGPVLFTKISTNKYNLLSLAPTTWTNEWTGTLSVSNQVFSRDLTRLTNYSGFVRFYDWNVLYSEPDFMWWRMVITDTNDVDHDNIPDFSDDLGLGAPRRPSLSLRRTTTNLLMTIAGDVGHLHQIQEKSAINNPSWSNVLSVTLTNDPQSVALPSPSGGAKFWRVQAF